MIAQQGPSGYRRRLFAALARLSGPMARIVAPLVVLAVLAGVAFAVRSALPAPLSGARLLDALTAIADAVAMFLASGLGIASLAFVAGAAIGWVAAVKWLGHHTRHRSLLLLDPRRADMSFVEGIDHVRTQSGSPRPGVDQAASAIVEAAARGRLSLWQRSGTNVLGRVSPRQIRLAGARLAIVAGKMEGNDRQGGVEFRLFRNEIEALWPSRRQLTIGDPVDAGSRSAENSLSVSERLRRTAEKFAKLK